MGEKVGYSFWAGNHAWPPACLPTLEQPLRIMNRCSHDYHICLCVGWDRGGWLLSQPKYVNRSILRVIVFCCLVMSNSVMLWNVAYQASLSMRFSRQEYWSGLPFLPPGDLPNPGIKLTSPASPALQVDSLPLSHLGSLEWVAMR